ncbi:MAG: putative porin [Chitinophagales bacterium]|nr:putative porin [Chitinophagales bacterium]
MVKKIILYILFLFQSIIIYAQTLITTPNPILRYETRYTTNDLNLKKIDTLLENFHQYDPKAKWLIPFISANLGNTPRPLFFDPTLAIGFQHGYSSIEKYFLQTDDVKFYNTKTPYTSAQYVFGAKEESLVEFSHSQNVSPQFNLAVDYQRPVSEGFYAHQKSGEHNLSISQWYKSKSNRYNWLSAYVFNQAKIQENGGVKVNNIFTNAAYAQDLSTAPVWLQSAENKFNQHKIFFIQTFYLGPKVAHQDSTIKKMIQPKYGLTHHFEYSSSKIYYKDDEQEGSSYFSEFYYSIDSTRDKTFSKSLTNELYFQNYAVKSADSSSTTFKYSWKGGVRYILNHYQQYNFNVTRHDLQLFGSLKNASLTPAKFDYSLLATIDLSPNYRGDFLTSANFKYQPNIYFYIASSANINRQSPSLKLENFETNHFQWKNNFKKMNIIQVSVKSGIPKWHIDIGADYYIVDNYLYFNQDALPEQLDKTLQVIRFFASKDFYLKNFVFKNKAIYQASNQQEVLHQPQFYIQSQWYYRGSYIKKKALHAQLGIEMTYFANHYADAYNPATMEYYLQNKEKLKYYPLIDVFFNLQVKRTRIFLKMQHLNQGWLKEKGYYSHPGSPASPRAFRLGVSWQFYD